MRYPSYDLVLAGYLAAPTRGDEIPPLAVMALLRAFHCRHHTKHGAFYKAQAHRHAGALRQCAFKHREVK